MLVIRDEQLARLAEEGRRRFIAAMVAHLRRHFHGELWAVGDEELAARAAQACDRAAAYGIRSERDVCRFLNLAAKFGWDFDRSPETSWMRAMLTDTSITSPGLRLDCLVDECLHRSEAAESNARLRGRFLAAGRGPGEDATDRFAAMRIVTRKL